MRHLFSSRAVAALAISLILAAVPGVTNAETPRGEGPTSTAAPSAQPLGAEVGRLYTHWPSRPEYHGIEIGTLYVHPAVWAQGQRIDVTLQVSENMAQHVCTDDEATYYRGLAWIRLGFKVSDIEPEFSNIHHPTTYDGRDIDVSILDDEDGGVGYRSVHWSTPLSEAPDTYQRLQPGRYGFSMTAPQSTEFARDIEILGDLQYSIITPHDQFGPCWRGASHTDARFVPKPIVDSGSTIKATAPAVAWGSGAKVTATVTSDAGVPTGRVMVTGSGGVSASARLVAAAGKGRAVVTLPRSLAVGKHRLTVTYPGEGEHRGATARVDLTVTKAPVKVAKVKVTKKPTSKTKGKARIVVKSTTGAPVNGKVTVTLKKGKNLKRVTATVKNGKTTVKLPKLAKGTWKATAVYKKTTNFKAGKSKTSKIKVTK